MARAQRPAPLIAAVLPLVLGLVPVPVSGQPIFGQNKIQYSEFEWRVMKTPHIDLHFYPEEEEVARWVAEVAEEAAIQFSEEMDLELPKPIPFMLYSNPYAFQQTNITPYLIGESVGGLTELVKGRVLVPHNGSYHMLRWVVRHELVHAFMLEKIEQVLREHKKTRHPYPPLWFIEGLAEFLAAEWDSRADMVLRDAVINDKLVPIEQLWRINGSFQMYKEGQSILLYIEREFGRDKVLQYLEDWWQAKSFERLTSKVLGITVEELGRGWVEDLKQRYFPQVRDRDSIKITGTRLVEHGRFSLKPCPLPPRPGQEAAGGGGDPPGERHAPGDTDYDFVFLSSYGDFTNIRVANHQPGVKPRRNGKPELLIKGGTSEQFESLHFFQSALDGNDRREIVLAAKKGERDALHIYDVDSRRLTATLEFPEIVRLRSPGWSPDGESIVFSGVNAAGRRDIYTVHRSGAGLTQLTDDHFDDLDPDWSPDGRWIVFASDRCPGGATGSYNLYLHDLERGGLQALTTGAQEDASPAWSPDGRLVAFRSNRDRQIYDLYVVDLGGHVRPIVKLQTAVLDPEWARDGRALLCTSFVDQVFAAFEVPVDTGDLPVEGRPPRLLAAGPLGPGVGAGVELPARWEPETPDTTYAVDDYRRSFGLDLMAAGVAYDPEFGGGGGGGQIALSDLLGNERLSFFLANDSSGRGGGGFLDGFDVGVTYFNLARRLNWGVGVFRLTRTYNVELDVFRREQRVGGLFIARYPLTRFNRIETSLVLRHISSHLYRRGIEDDTFFITNYLTYVHDSTLWNLLGPFNGARYNVGLALTTDIGEGIGDYTSMLFDYRRYHRPFRRMTYAFRALGRFSFGSEGQLYFVGGPFTLRGYPRRSLLGRRIMLVNNEVRFPFIERMLLRLPLGLMDMPVLYTAGFFDIAWFGDPDWERPVGSLGFGVYIGGGPYPRLRLDFTRTTDFRTLAKQTRTEFSIGFNY